MEDTNELDNSVVVDNKTYEMIKTLVSEAEGMIGNIRQQVSDKVNTITTVFLNAKGIEGEYKLSEDMKILKAM